MSITGLSQPAAANDRHAVLIVDGNNGAVLHADKADELRYPASLTKMMTIYMAFDAVQRGRTTFNTRMKVSQEAASAAPTKLDLDPGETITLIDAVKALITKSANDAAIVIAEHLGGTEANFARQMTAKARLFGMSRTTFRNASGLPDPGQVTTARDMVRLALRLQDDFPQHYHLFSLRSFTYEGSSYRNHNALLGRFQGTDGIKTGYTRASGFNLVSSVRRGGRHVVGAIFGGASGSQRDYAMQMLLSRALVRSSPYKTRRPAPVLVAAAEPARRPPPGVTQPPVIAPQPVAAARPRPVMVPRVRQDTQAIAAAKPVHAPQPVVQPSPRAPAAIPPSSPGSGELSVEDVQGTLASALVQPPPPPSSPAQHAAADVSQGAGHRLQFAPRGYDWGGADQPARAAAPVPPTPAQARSASTLDRQAALLERETTVLQPVAAVPEPRRVMPQPYAVRGPVPPPAYHQPAVQQSASAATQAIRSAGPSGSSGIASGSGPSGGYEIQIGAYATSLEAERALSSARGAAGELLRSASARAIAAKKDARQIYRARFAGFDSRGAASTCLELRRRQIDCFVMRGE